MGPKALLPLRREAEDFFALKIRRLRPGANPRTWVPKASTLPLDQRSRTSSLLGPNILLNTPFSKTLSLRSSLNGSDQVSHPYKTAGKITVLYITSRNHHSKLNVAKDDNRGDRTVSGSIILYDSGAA
jgi:hypothetical protein